MKGNELIEKILNNEIKSGTLIKMKSHYPGLEWEKTICFNGNWFSEEKYYPGVPRYDDIILYLCSDCMTFEIIEEDKKIEKLETYKEIDDDEHYANILKVSKNGEYEITEDMSVVIDKINEITDYLEENK